MVIAYCLNTYDMHRIMVVSYFFDEKDTMKILRFILCIILAGATSSISAEEGGFWGWLTGVTSSAWEGTKNTFYSVFGGKPEQKESYKKEEVREVSPTETEDKKEEVIIKEKTPSPK